MTKKKPKTIEYNPIVEPKRAHGYRGVRWVENASLGLRLVGFADVIARDVGSRSIQHTGWFIDDFQEETCRGVVYQLPSRGKTLYAYGYADSMNEGAALLCFDLETDKLDAAKAADRFAEIFAESAREYNEAWQAGRRADDIADEIKAARTEALALGEEMRAAKAANVAAPTICATLRSTIKSLYRDIQRARKERAELIENFGHREGFAE